MIWVAAILGGFVGGLAALFGAMILFWAIDDPVYEQELLLANRQVLDTVFPR